VRSLSSTEALVDDEIQKNLTNITALTTPPYSNSQWVTPLVSARVRAMREYSVSNFVCDGD
jgi:hypothetical protein